MESRPTPCPPKGVWAAGPCLLLPLLLLLLLSFAPGLAQGGDFVCKFCQCNYDDSFLGNLNNYTLLVPPYAVANETYCKELCPKTYGPNGKGLESAKPACEGCYQCKCNYNHRYGTMVPTEYMMTMDFPQLVTDTFCRDICPSVANLTIGCWDGHEDCCGECETQCTQGSATCPAGASTRDAQGHPFCGGYTIECGCPFPKTRVGLGGFCPQLGRYLYPRAGWN